MATYQKVLDIPDPDDFDTRQVVRATALRERLHFASDAERERLFDKILSEWSAETQRKRRDMN